MYALHATVRVCVCATCVPVSESASACMTYACNLDVCTAKRVTILQVGWKTIPPRSVDFFTLRFLRLYHVKYVLLPFFKFRID